SRARSPLSSSTSRERCFRTGSPKKRIANVATRAGYQRVAGRPAPGCGPPDAGRRYTPSDARGVDGDAQPAERARGGEGGIPEQLLVELQERDQPDRWVAAAGAVERGLGADEHRRVRHGVGARVDLGDLDARHEPGDVVAQARDAGADRAERRAVTCQANGRP